MTSLFEKQNFMLLSPTHLFVASTDGGEVGVEEDGEEVESEAPQLDVLTREECEYLVTHRLHVLHKNDTRD